MWIIVAEYGIRFKKICAQTNVVIIRGIDRDKGIFVKTMFLYKESRACSFLNFIGHWIVGASTC